MSGHESDLKLQAHLDGELPASEAVHIEQLLANDANAQALMSELRRTKSAMTGGELARSLPESREFFWSKIQREITRENKPVAIEPANLPWFGWVQKYFLKAGGAVAAVCLLMFLILSPARKTHSGKIEIACDSMGAYTYRDQQEGITMVWLYDRNTDDSEFTDVSASDKVTPE